ncbi:uncharacterized protein LOC111365067 [Spodoptera litura]|uniref:Uncharacterized protein LOC111365067 n=1 Tax=Spodoptera litura TaxID=69820 RepID=A0A9J7EXZ0_SPOLT|nr:uncharacterized protein LOC111365067 [Spodoptera litura]XP_022838022.1 uncharacterized protein LOC111365067 [Spodoptera litura]
MGGCRCSYRTCSLRTDGKTHMFHYPVFDKVRCHQWITNARKLEFLNLKVSQLRNRVVCQHHFKDENFMNFKKDKLTFDAVPTEDGPFCDASESDKAKAEQDESKVFSISLDDIENEYLTIGDKKANFSVKYGDFLTNCELMDLNSLNTTNQAKDNSQIDLNDNTKLIPVITKDLVLPKKPVKCVQPQIRKSTRGKQLKTFEKSVPNNSSVKENIINHDLFQDTMQPNVIELSKQSEIQQSDLERNAINFTINVSEVPVEFSTSVCQEDKPDETKFSINHLNQIQLIEEKLDEPSHKDNQPGETNLNHESNKNINQLVAVEMLNKPNETTNTNRSLLKETKKIKIISEKKIVNPRPIFGKLEPVSPTRVLTFPNKRKVFNSKPTSGIELVKVSVAEEIPMRAERNPVTETNSSAGNIVEKFNNKSEVIDLSEGITTTEVPKTVMIKTRNANNIAPTTSLLKNKIPPERVAAIAEKRKFNMKLRDIVEDCLDKLDEPQKTDYEKRPTLQETRLLQSKKRQVASHLSEESQLPNVQDYTLAFLEARMKKMENNLLNKIEENSQRILELKQAYAPSNSKRSVHTQTQVGEDVHKRHLYQELSKYLSQEANSLLYEELFINKYTKDMPKCSSPKRRKRR